MHTFEDVTAACNADQRTIVKSFVKAPTLGDKITVKEAEDIHYLYEKEKFMTMHSNNNMEPSV